MDPEASKDELVEGEGQEIDPSVFPAVDENRTKVAAATDDALEQAPIEIPKELQSLHPALLEALTHPMAKADLTRIQRLIYMSLWAKIL